MQENTAIIEKKLYYKEWRAKNRERIRNYNAKYWESRALRKNETTNDDTEPQGQAV